MIKLDYKKYFQDYMWFGIHYSNDGYVSTITSGRIGKSNFWYSRWWTLRLWPCLQDDQTLPNWYMAIWDYFGYAKEYEEGVE